MIVDTWRLGHEVPEEVAAGGKQVHEAVHRRVQTGRNRARRLHGEDGHRVARELGISPESLRGWYRQAKADRGEGQAGELTTAEHEELKRLRRQNAEQAKTIEVLRKAAVFFAKESDR
ncbi:transposase [Streptomyces inhibens]|uniref:transposase n=1 Tax=Streptomyces inhibens TaxID=2293571 RepID=UPI00369AF2A5